MNKLIRISLLILVNCLNVGCHDDVSPIEFDFKLLDEQGNQSSNFQVGEDIIFSFRAKKVSDGDVLITKSSINQETFIRLYKRNNLSPKLKTLVGIPYSRMFCEHCLCPKIILSDSELLKIETTWYKKELPNFRESFLYCRDNELTLPLLDQGKYTVVISTPIHIEWEDSQSQVMNLSFEINFTIY